MKKRSAGRLLVLLLMVALMTAPFLAGCGESSMTITSGVITMGSDTAYPPFESMEGNKAVGFDVDVAEAIAKKLDLELEVISDRLGRHHPGSQVQQVRHHHVGDDNHPRAQGADQLLRPVHRQRPVHRGGDGLTHQERGGPQGQDRGRTARHDRPVQGRGAAAGSRASRRSRSSTPSCSPSRRSSRARSTPSSTTSRSTST